MLSRSKCTSLGIYGTLEKKKTTSDQQHQQLIELRMIYSIYVRTYKEYQAFF